MENNEQAVDAKTHAILRELVGDRAVRLRTARPAPDVRDAITRALGGDYPAEVAAHIAFHLTDWGGDVAFLTVLHLFPERFTMAEIKAGVMNIVVHVPNHLAAAAKLAGYPIEDVFGLGSLTEETG